jgi:SAF domain
MFRLERVVQLDSRDNILIALEDLTKGETVSHGHIHVTLLSDVPAKHKFPIADLALGNRVTMYGVLVGKALEPGVAESCTLVESYSRSVSLRRPLRRVSLGSAGHLVLERRQVLWLCAAGRASRHAQLLDYRTAGVLREPQHLEPQASL